MVCFSLTPKLLVVCCSTGTQAWDSDKSWHSPTICCVAGHAVSLQKKAWLSLQPFAKLNSTGFYVCIFCSVSQQTELLFYVFLLSIFFFPYIYGVFKFLISWNTGLSCVFLVFFFSLSTWFLFIIPFVLTLLLLMWWGGFLAAENHRECGSYEENSYFSVVLPYLCRSFPRKCFLLLDKHKTIPSYNHRVVLMCYWFQCSIKSRDTWWVSEITWH